MAASADEPILARRVRCDPVSFVVFKSMTVHVWPWRAVFASVVLLLLGAACSPASPTPPLGPASVAGPESGPSAPAVSGPPYRLDGTIKDAASADPVPGARVELLADVTGSLPSIAVATAGPDGRYSLDGVPAVSEIRVTHDGYVGTTARVELAGSSTRDFNLAWDSAYAFAGAYTLTIEADDACPSAPQPLPADLRRRTFLAEVQQAGSRLTVSIASPCQRDGWSETGCRFTGRASTNGATFQLRDPSVDVGYALMPDLVERLGWSIDLRTGVGDNSGLWFFGVATTHIIPNGLSGRLAGTITLHSWITPPNYPIVAGCGAGRFEMSGR